MQIAILGESRTGPAAGATLLVDAPVPEPALTPYARWGDVFGWLCLVWLVVWRYRSRAAAR